MSMEVGYLFHEFVNGCSTILTQSYIRQERIKRTHSTLRNLKNWLYHCSCKSTDVTDTESYI